MNKITVITICYNHANYIAQTIESVLNQTLEDFTYIIWDDGSTDCSCEIIQKYAEQDKRIQFNTHENKANKGLPFTMQTCVNKVNTEYVAFLEGDDYWDEHFLEIMFSSAEKNKDVGLFYSDINAFGEKELEKEVLRHKKMIKKHQSYIKTTTKIERSFFLFNLPIMTVSSVFARTNIL